MDGGRNYLQEIIAGQQRSLQDLAKLNNFLQWINSVPVGISTVFRLEDDLANFLLIHIPECKDFIQQTESGWMLDTSKWDPNLASILPCSFRESNENFIAKYVDVPAIRGKLIVMYLKGKYNSGDQLQLDLACLGESYKSDLIIKLLNEEGIDVVYHEAEDGGRGCIRPGYYTVSVRIE